MPGPLSGEKTMNGSFHQFLVLRLRQGKCKSADNSPHRNLGQDAGTFSRLPESIGESRRCRLRVRLAVGLVCKGHKDTTHMGQQLPDGLAPSMMCVETHDVSGEWVMTGWKGNGCSGGSRWQCVVQSFVSQQTRAGA